MWFTTRGLQLPKVVQTIIDANNSIPENPKKVNSNERNSKKAEGRGVTWSDLEPDITVQAEDNLFNAGRFCKAEGEK